MIKDTETDTVSKSFLSILGSSGVTGCVPSPPSPLPSSLPRGLKEPSQWLLRLTSTKRGGYTKELGKTLVKQPWLPRCLLGTRSHAKSRVSRTSFNPHGNLSTASSLSSSKSPDPCV